MGQTNFARNQKKRLENIKFAEIPANLNSRNSYTLQENKSTGIPTKSWKWFSCLYDTVGSNILIYYHDYSKRERVYVHISIYNNYNSFITLSWTTSWSTFHINLVIFYKSPKPLRLNCVRPSKKICMFSVPALLLFRRFFIFAFVFHFVIF